MPYTYARGETVTVFLEAAGSAESALDGINVTAVLKKLAANRPLVMTPAAAEFFVARRAADVEVGPGWSLTLAATDTASLSGNYATNAVLNYPDGTVEKSEQLILSFVDATS